MKSGHVKLNRLLAYIQGHPTIPYKNRDPDVFGPFQSIYHELFANVPEVPGWYAWINRLAGDQHPIVYVGQSQSRKTSSLKARLIEELLDEHVALWATVHNPDDVFRTLDSKSNGKYTGDIRRSLRKAGTTDIVWLANYELTDDQLNYVEHKLIKIFKPPANRRKPKFLNEYPNLLGEILSTLRIAIRRILSANDS